MQKFSTPLEHKKMYDSGHIRDFSHSISPLGQHNSEQERFFSDYDFHYGRKKDHVSEHPASSAVQDTAKEVPFPLALPKTKG